MVPIVVGCVRAKSMAYVLEIIEEAVLLLACACCSLLFLSILKNIDKTIDSFKPCAYCFLVSHDTAY